MKNLNTLFKGRTLFFLVFVIPVSVFGQGWIKSYAFETDFTGDPRKIIHTTDGGFLIIDEYLNSVKVDQDGVKEWEIEEPSFEGFEIDIGYGLWENLITNNFELFGVGTDQDGNAQTIRFFVSQAGEVLDFEIVDIPSYNGDITDEFYSGFLFEDGGSILFNHCFHKFKEDGSIDLNWNLNFNDFQFDIIETFDGNLAAIGELADSSSAYSSYFQLSKFSLEGQVIDSFQIQIDSLANISPYQFAQNKLGDFLIMGNIYPQEEGGLFVLLTDSLGDIKKTELFLDDNFMDPFDGNIISTSNNEFIYIISWYSQQTLDHLTEIGRIDPNGNILWRRKLLASTNLNGFDLTQVDDFTFCALGAKSYGIPNLIKFDINGTIYTNAISGKLFQDQNSNCQFDTLDNFFGNWTIEATNQQTQEQFYTLADTSGNFQMDLDTGNYIVKSVIFQDYWTACEDSILVEMPNFNDTTEIEFALQPLANCPLMTVDISAPFLRRCFSNNIYVNYCNLGAETATNAQIEVRLDEFMIYETADITPSFQSDTLLIFDIGDVEFGECGSFKIEALIDCDSTVLGQTHCMEAHIFPDTLCLASAWLNGNISITPECTADSVLFHFKNIGEDMNNPLPYIVIEDNIIAKEGDYQLMAGGTTTISVTVNPDKTYHCQAEQPTNFPPILGNMNASATIEGCAGNINIGAFNSFPEDDGEPYLSIDCQQNIGAFDPNDKRGYPFGLGEEHFIEANEDLDYHIRFQNTGTDTAFQVIIRDTLSQFLNVGSVRTGVSSHPYDFEILGNGILKFTFNDIMLPDSNINEPASHGFVKFRIEQKRDLPIGTIIENSAAIYFDFNEPVITNTTFHEIGEDYAQVLPTPIFEIDKTPIPIINCAPNPFRDFTVFDLRPNSYRDENQEIIFELFSLNGQKIREEKVSEKQFRFEKGDLGKGMFVYRFSAKGRLLGTGKLVIH